MDFKVDKSKLGWDIEGIERLVDEQRGDRESDSDDDLECTVEELAGLID